MVKLFAALGPGAPPFQRSASPLPPITCFGDRRVFLGTAGGQAWGGALSHPTADLCEAPLRLPFPGNGKIQPLSGGDSPPPPPLSLAGRPAPQRGGHRRPQGRARAAGGHRAAGRAHTLTHTAAAVPVRALTQDRTEPDRPRPAEHSEEAPPPPSPPPPIPAPPQAPPPQAPPLPRVCPSHWRRGACAWPSGVWRRRKKTPLGGAGPSAEGNVVAVCVPSLSLPHAAPGPQRHRPLSLPPGESPFRSPAGARSGGRRWGLAVAAATAARRGADRWCEAAAGRGWRRGPGRRPGAAASPLRWCCSGRAAWGKPPWCCATARTSSTTSTSPPCRCGPRRRRGRAGSPCPELPGQAEGGVCLCGSGGGGSPLLFSPSLAHLLGFLAGASPPPVALWHSPACPFRPGVRGVSLRKPALWFRCLHLVFTA